MPTHVITEVPCNLISGLRHSYNYMCSGTYYLILGALSLPTSNSPRWSEHFSLSYILILILIIHLLGFPYPQYANSSLTMHEYKNWGCRKQWYRYHLDWYRYQSCSGSWYRYHFGSSEWYRYHFGWYRYHFASTQVVPVPPLFGIGTSRRN